MSPEPYIGPPLGARTLPGGRCEFRVWAPNASRCEVLLGDGRSARMEAEQRGYHAVRLARIRPGATYSFRLSGAEGEVKERPDPASRAQPEGVHGPSAVVSSAFPWVDEAWRGLSLREYVIYELHVGTFTPAGTFEGAIPHLDSLKELGVSAIELMPVAQFPGERNWGYDGVYPFAAQHSYGGAEGLKRLVDACHQRGLAVILDVVYNHLGPEGNYLRDFGPYFTERYQTPWGDALNFDGARSDEVRAFFVQSALQWIDEFHIDALRLDAVHAILDTSPYPFLEELADAVRQVSERLGRQIHLIAESDANDPRLIRPKAAGGFGLDGVWVDDFHHALHALLTGEREGYYEDYGTVDHVVRALSDGFVYTGAHSGSRGRRHGREPGEPPAEKLIVCSQNHDQVGNRMLGERLTSLLSPEAVRVAAATVLVSPYTPLLFMGEEYGETAPFPYFISHGDAALVNAVRSGRRDEFAAFSWEHEPPDPQAVETFESARLRRERAKEPDGLARLTWYGELLRLRREIPALTSARARHQVASLSGAPAVTIRRRADGQSVLVVLVFGSGRITPLENADALNIRLHSEETRFGGSGLPLPEPLQPGHSMELRGPWAAVFAS